MDPEVNMGIFGGIISGLVAAWTYNRFKEQKLPVVFLFCGRKIPIDYGDDSTNNRSCFFGLYLAAHPNWD